MVHLCLEYLNRHSLSGVWRGICQTPTHHLTNFRCPDPIRGWDAHQYPRQVHRVGRHNSNLWKTALSVKTPETHWPKMTLQFCVYPRQFPQNSPRPVTEASHAVHKQTQKQRQTLQFIEFNLHGQPSKKSKITFLKVMLNSQGSFLFIKMKKKLLIFFKLWLTESQKIVTDLTCLKGKIIFPTLKKWDMRNAHILSAQCTKLRQIKWSRASSLPRASLNRKEEKEASFFKKTCSKRQLKSSLRALSTRVKEKGKRGRKDKARQKARRNIKTLISQKNLNGNDTSRIIAHKR